MILTKTLTKTWWRSLVKGDSTEETQIDGGDLESEEVDEETLEGADAATDLDDDGQDEASPQSEDFEEEEYDLPRRGPVQRTKVDSVKDFFSTEIIYRFDIIEPVEQNKLRGSYRLEIKGNKGGVWTLMIGDQLEVLNRREEAEVVISCQQRDFLQLINGDLNPQVAILAQKMKLNGEARKAVMLQSLLYPVGVD